MPCEDLLKVIKMSQTKVQLSKQIPVLSQHRSSRRRCSVKKMLLKVLEISRKAFVLECIFNNIVDLQPLGCFVKKKCLKIFTGKHFWCLWLSLFFKMLQTEGLIKKRLQHRCFPVQFAKFLRASVLKNICELLLLEQDLRTLLWCGIHS